MGVQEGVNHLPVSKSGLRRSGAGGGWRVGSAGRGAGLRPRGASRGNLLLLARTTLRAGILGVVDG